MCLVLIAYKSHPRYPLIIAANRDEFYNRPTRQAHYWEDHPQILGGRDLEKGGTWMAIDIQGRVAAVTNYREPSDKRGNLSSRGFLVTDFLFGKANPEKYLSALSTRVRDYDGFNLFAGDTSSLYIYGSYRDRPVLLEEGIHGISNGDLDYPWPKVSRGKQAVKNVIESNEEIKHDLLFPVLLDREIPDEADLAGTDTDKELERMLAPVFIVGNEFGTRSSTVLTIEGNGSVLFSERCFDSAGTEQGSVTFEFRIE